MAKTDAELKDLADHALGHRTLYNVTLHEDPDLIYLAELSQVEKTQLKVYADQKLVPIAFDESPVNSLDEMLSIVGDLSEDV